MTLIYLDLRWNHAGLVGGRALVDLLKWNRTLTDLEVAGNEIPDDLLRGIGSGLERNKERWYHELNSKAHAQSLASTIHSLSATHNAELLKLQEKLDSENFAAQKLSEKLGDASAELERMQSAYKAVLEENKRLVAQRDSYEHDMTIERSNIQKQLEALQRELSLEKQVKLFKKENPEL